MYLRSASFRKQLQNKLRGIIDHFERSSFRTLIDLETNYWPTQ